MKYCGSATNFHTDITIDDATFQWGLGASYALTNNFSVFVDYVELYNDNVDFIDWSFDAYNFGVTYQF